MNIIRTHPQWSMRGVGVVDDRYMSRWIKKRSLGRKRIANNVFMP
jgi:hypothetical protein